MKNYLSFILFILISFSVYSQNSNNNALKFGSGLGLSQSHNFTGLGTSYFVG